MSDYRQPVAELIRRRHSQRSFSNRSIPAAARQQLKEYLDQMKSGPFGAKVRFRLEAAAESDRTALRGLGTYGAIRGNAGFIIGAVGVGIRHLEDFGWALEKIVLLATDIGLGTCWLGGNFTRSSFTRRIAPALDEQMPAVLAIGVVDRGNPPPSVPLKNRLSWRQLFFMDAFRTPLEAEDAGMYSDVLEMVRLAPSASNKQPWRILRSGNLWHFYLQRTPGYPPGFASRLLQISDLQRIDMGIAMCHFELMTRELGLTGMWQIHDPEIGKGETGREYISTWQI